MEVDTLAWLASTKDADQLKVVPIEVLDSPSIQIIKEPQTVSCAMTKDNWMTPIIQYLKVGVLPE